MWPDRAAPVAQRCSAGGAAGLGPRVPLPTMGSLFRSEKMTMAQLFLQTEVPPPPPPFHRGAFYAFPRRVWYTRVTSRVPERARRAASHGCTRIEGEMANYKWIIPVSRFPGLKNQRSDPI